MLATRWRPAAAFVRAAEPESKPLIFFLVVVVVLRTPHAELSDAAVRPDQRHASIATSSAALWTHEGGVAHRHGCVLYFTTLYTVL